MKTRENRTLGNETGMLPLYLARIEDLGRADLVQVDCAACHHVAVLPPDFLLRLGLNPEVDQPSSAGDGRGACVGG